MIEEKDKITPLSIIKATETPVDLTVSEQFDYGVSPKYERKKYDSQAARKKFHESQFGDKKTITDDSGEILHKSHDSAKSKYGEKRASFHQAEADHIDPLKDIHERVEKDPLKKAFLTDEDIKEIGNRKKNFQELSKHENASKKEKRELQRGIETHDVKRAVKGLKIQTETDLMLTGRAIKNAAVAATAITAGAAGAAIETGKETALVALTVSGLNNLAYVASGQKDLETALEDVASDTVSSFTSGASVRMAQEIVAGVANVCGADQIANFVANKFPAAEIAMAAMTFNTMKRYLNGDISAEDCAFQIIANGAGALAYQFGMAIGGPAGAIVASVVMTQITNAILEYKQEQKIQKERAAEIDRVLSHAMAEITRQRNNLRAYVQADLDRWDNAINSGFEMILFSAMNNNSIGVADGLNMILTLFNDHVLYPSLEAFDKDFYNPNEPPLIL